MEITDETLIAMKDKTKRMHRKLLRETKNLSVKEKIEHICDYFTKNYKYDYSILNPQNCQPRKPIVKRVPYYKNHYECTTVQKILNVDVDGEKLTLSPSLHLMKLGTCSTFSAEMKYFLTKFGVKYKEINEVSICYDRDYPKTKYGKIRPMLHYYLVTKFDNELYKIDIAGAIMAKDYNEKSEDGTRVDFAAMTKTKNPHKSPFEKLFKKQEQEKNA